MYRYIPLTGSVTGAFSGSFGAAFVAGAWVGGGGFLGLGCKQTVSSSLLI